MYIMYREGKFGLYYDSLRYGMFLYTGVQNVSLPYMLAYIFENPRWALRAVL